jgi:hypothetical protein
MSPGFNFELTPRKPGIDLPPFRVDPLYIICPANDKWMENTPILLGRQTFCLRPVMPVSFCGIAN